MGEDIDAFVFLNTSLDGRWRTPEYGCDLFLTIVEESHYLDEERREKLRDVCNRSVYSVDVNSYYGKVFGMEGGISEEQIDALLVQALTPFAGGTLDERRADYVARASTMAATLTAANVAAYNCSEENPWPFVGGVCGYLTFARSSPERIYDERYVYALSNQLARSRRGLQPIFLVEMSQKPSLSLQSKALVLDGLMYYYTQEATGEYAYGKMCLLRGNLLEWAASSDDEAIRELVMGFVASENYEAVESVDLEFNSDYLASLWECAQAQVKINPEDKYVAVAGAYRAWQARAEYVSEGMLIEPSLAASSLYSIPTITNSIIASLLAQAGR
jgi:hypothetical protein